MGRKHTHTHKNTETKQNEMKNNKTYRQGKAICHRQTKHNKTPGGCKFAPLLANQLLWRANQHEHAWFGLSSPQSLPSRSGMHNSVCRSPALAFSTAIHFAMKRPAPRSAVLCHHSSSWAAIFHSNTVLYFGSRATVKLQVYSAKK